LLLQHPSVVRTAARQSFRFHFKNRFPLKVSPNFFHSTVKTALLCHLPFGRQAVAASRQLPTVFVSSFHGAASSLIPFTPQLVRGEGTQEQEAAPEDL
jgi:hypothetical protein